MKKARIRLLYENKKQLDYILKHNKYAHKYFDFTPKKWSFKNAPKEQDGRYIDRQYLYEQTGNYDGVMALLDGNDLKGVYGNHKSINGKIIMQTEFQEGVYRTWEEKGITERVQSYLKGEGIGKWKLGKTRRKTSHYQPIYSFDHECGHGASAFYNVEDKLHFFVNEKSYEDFWTYLDEMLEPKNPQELLPLVQRKADKLIKNAKIIGLDLRITSGFRSFEEQNKLYAQGRTTKGNIVTNAKGGESFHNFGCAFDIVDRKKGYNLTDKEWSWLAFIGRWIGLEWGGDWKSFVDKPHFQLTLGYSLKDFQNNKVDYAKFK